MQEQLTIVDMAIYCINTAKYAADNNLTLTYAKRLTPNGKYYNQYKEKISKISRNIKFKPELRKELIKALNRINELEEKRGNSSILFFCPRTKRLYEQNIGVSKGILSYGKAIRATPLNKALYECHSIITGEFMGIVDSRDLLKSNDDPQFEFRRKIIENESPKENATIIQAAANIKKANQIKLAKQKAAERKQRELERKRKLEKKREPLSIGNMDELSF